MKMKQKHIHLFLLAAVICAGGVKLVEDAPIEPPSQPGDVTGTIAPAEKVAEMTAVSRVTGKRYAPESFDAGTGRFVFRRLPGDATYDVCVRTTDGRVIEGIDLDFVDQRMLRLAAKRRKQLGLPPEREHQFTRDDVKELRKFVADLKDFMEIRRVLYIRAHGRRATMLVELMRTREFHSSTGEYVWRVELWYFERKFGGWEKLANQERVLRRRRVQPAEWKKIHVEYYPQLSVHVDRTGAAERIEFEIPDKPDASRGRVSTTAVELKTVPHVIGLDEAPTSQPTTQEAS